MAPCPSKSFLLRLHSLHTFPCLRSLWCHRVTNNPGNLGHNYFLAFNFSSQQTCLLSDGGLLHSLHRVADLLHHVGAGMVGDHTSSNNQLGVSLRISVTLSLVICYIRDRVRQWVTGEQERVSFWCWDTHTHCGKEGERDGLQHGEAGH